jgi:hypothetical protein
MSRSPAKSLLLAVVGYLYSVNLFPVNVILASKGVASFELLTKKHSVKIRKLYI